MSPRAKQLVNELAAMNGPWMGLGEPLINELAEQAEWDDDVRSAATELLEYLAGEERCRFCFHENDYGGKTVRCSPKCAVDKLEIALSMGDEA